MMQVTISDHLTHRELIACLPLLENTYEGELDLIRRAFQEIFSFPPFGLSLWHDEAGIVAYASGMWVRAVPYRDDHEREHGRMR